MNDPRTVELTITGDPQPDGFSGEYSVQQLAEMSADHPARVRVTFTNTATEPMTFRFSSPAPFSDSVGTKQDEISKLVLVRPTTTTTRSDGCWEHSVGGQPASVAQTLDPNKQIHIDWSIFSHRKNEECFPAGNYRFEDEVEVNGSTYRWGFTVSVGVLAET